MMKLLECSETQNKEICCLARFVLALSAGKGYYYKVFGVLSRCSYLFGA